MKIPIKKTNRKVPRSRYKTFTVDHRFGFAGTTIPRLAPQPIQEISKGLENPLWCEHIFPSDWKMCYNKDNTTYYAPDPKPSLLTKLKNREKEMIDLEKLDGYGSDELHDILEQVFEAYLRKKCRYAYIRGVESVQKQVADINAREELNK